MEQTFQRVLSAWVRAMRGERSQPEFAAFVGIPHSTISQLETGGRVTLAVHVEQIRTAHNLSVQQVLAKMLELALTPQPAGYVLGTGEPQRRGRPKKSRK